MLDIIDRRHLHIFLMRLGELVFEGVLEISGNMQICLKIPTQYALAIANDGRTDLYTGYLLRWVLESRTASDKEIVREVRNFERKIIRLGIDEGPDSCPPRP